MTVETHNAEEAAEMFERARRGEFRVFSMSRVPRHNAWIRFHISDPPEQPELAGVSQCQPERVQRRERVMDGVGVPQGTS